MKIDYYHVDCFTENRFYGNPAAVCVMPEWLPDTILQAMAHEHNLPATAFIKKDRNDVYTIRWFGPENEISLCGHGSIGAAFVVFHYLHPDWHEVKFKAPFYTVPVQHKHGSLILNLPTQQLTTHEATSELIKAIGVKPVEVYCDNTCLAVLENEQQVIQAKLDMPIFRQLPYRNLIITAPGTTVDFVSRNFYIEKEVTEDPVTGSAHCILAPYWANRLNKTYLTAKQVSKRGGDLICEINQDHVRITAKAVLYQKGTIEFEPASRKN